MKELYMRNNLVKLAYCVKLSKAVNYMHRVRMLKFAALSDLEDKISRGEKLTDDEKADLRQIAKGNIATNILHGMGYGALGGGTLGIIGGGISGARGDIDKYYDDGYYQAVHRRGLDNIHPDNIHPDPRVRRALTTATGAACYGLSNALAGTAGGAIGGGLYGLFNSKPRRARALLEKLNDKK